MPDAPSSPIVRSRLAAALLGVVAAAGVGTLAATGHDRVVAALAFTTLLVAVLDATALALVDHQ